LTNEFRQFELDILEVSETHIPGVGSMKLADIELVYSGRRDWVYRQEGVFMMNEEALRTF